MLMLSMTGMSCSRPAYGAAKLPLPEIDLPAPTTQPAEQTAVFAAGCFWCTEAAFEQIEGVKDVVSGYAGGTQATATYKVVSTGETGHAEAIRITYDPSKISYGQLLRIFFTTHDPTTRDRQGPDVGRQYRSAIFYETDDQKRVAEAYIRQLTQAKVFARPITTTVEPLHGFYTAEAYHQDYVEHNPQSLYVQQWALPKVEKVREAFPDRVKPTSQPAR
jgi:peptide-methionine (S)-S-oxide reductase